MNVYNIGKKKAVGCGLYLEAVSVSFLNKPIAVSSSVKLL